MSSDHFQEAGLFGGIYTAGFHDFHKPRHLQRGTRGEEMHRCWPRSSCETPAAEEQGEPGASCGALVLQAHSQDLGAAAAASLPCDWPHHAHLTFGFSRL